MMTHALNELLKTGRTLVYDGYTEAKSDRTFVAQLARQAGYNMLTVWVQTESVSAKSRATRRRRDGGGMSEDEFDAALRRFTTPGVAEKPIVISGKHTYASQLKIVLSRLVVPPAAAPDPTVRVRPATHRVILR
jgi:predicted kinase